MSYYLISPVSSMSLNLSVEVYLVYSCGTREPRGGDGVRGLVSFGSKFGSRRRRVTEVVSYRFVLVEIFLFYIYLRDVPTVRFWLLRCHLYRPVW